MNWYKNIRMADASSAEDESGLDAFSPDSPIGRDKGQIRYFDRHSPLPYQIGDTVRLRQVGIGFPQIDGVVVNVSEGEGVTVEWHSGKGREGKKERFTVDQAQAALDRIA